MVKSICKAAFLKSQSILTRTIGKRCIYTYTYILSTSGDMYNGTYFIAFTVGIYYGRYVPSFELRDNADNVIQIGATGFVQTDDFDAATDCHDNTYTPDDYYISYVPFHLQSAACNGDERQYVFYVSEPSSVLATFASDVIDPVNCWYTIGDEPAVLDISFSVLTETRHQANRLHNRF